MDNKKLKTLKDLEQDSPIWIETPYKKKKYYKMAFSKTLREEAIKWIKELRKLHKKRSYTEVNLGLPKANWVNLSDKPNTYDLFTEDFHIYHNYGDLVEHEGDYMITWIKHFFNLTEDDIK